MTAATFDPFALTLVVLLTVILPVVGIWEFTRLGKWLVAGRQDARTATYRWIIGLEWSLTIGLLAWWLGMGRGTGAAGLIPAPVGRQWLTVGLGLGLAALQIWQMTTVTGNQRKLAEVRAKIGGLRNLVPHNENELKLFSVLAVTAGVCEEIIYRGLLLAVLTPPLGLWPAVGVSSLVFGFGHVYQGVGGVLKTTVVGLVMALAVVFSGSLWTSILLHVVIDLTSGRMMAAAIWDEMSAQILNSGGERLA